MRSARLIVAGLALASLVGTALAKKLDKPICDDLKVELGLLQQQGVAVDIAKGPEWAKTNVSRERLKEIERLIFVEEQLTFRCPQPKKPIAPGEEDDDGSGPLPKSAKGQAKAAPAAKPAQAKAASGETPPAPAKKVVKAAPPAEQATTKEAAATPRPAPKAKSKADDAYSPAAGSGQTSGSVFPNN